MKPIFRTLAIALSLGVSAAAFAQATPKAGAAGANPASRGDNIFYYAPLQGGERANIIGNPLNNQSAVGRANPRSHTQVTPVPEPSQWAMMLAGLALVGFIVRRSSKRS